MANQWFKLYGVEMMADPKFLRLSASERSCWLTLLCLASMDDGVIKNVEESYLMSHSGINPNTPEWTNTNGILLKFEILGMITIEKDVNGLNCINIKNWKKRQGQAMTGYERVKKYRENKRLSENDNEMITNDNGQNRIEENRIEENRIDNKTIAVSMLKESKKTKSSRLNTGYSEKFESFWSAYPNKIAKGKAYEVFQLLSEDLQSECIKAVINQNTNNHFWLDFANNGNGADQPPHPTTWLNQKRWEDTVVLKVRAGRNSTQTNSKANGVLKFN